MLSATVILYSARWKTITIAICEYLISNQPGPAFALGTILIVIIFSCIYAVNRFLGMTMSALFTSRATKAASTVTPATPVTRVASG